MPSSKRKAEEMEREKQKIARTNQKITNLFKTSGAAKTSSPPTATTSEAISSSSVAAATSGAAKTSSPPTAATSEAISSSSVAAATSGAAKTSSPPTAATSGRYRLHRLQRHVEDEISWAIFTTFADQNEGTVDLVLCALCKRHRIHGKNGKKTWSEDGYRLLRDDKLKDHQDSDQHKEAIGIELNLTIQEASEKMASVATEAIIYALRCLYFLISNNLPLDLLKNVMDLCIVTGSTTLSQFRKSKNATYSSWDIINELLCTINKHVEEQVTGEIKSSPTYSLMCDEVADNRSIKHLAVCSQYIAQSGDIKTAFLFDKELPMANAETITTTLLSSVEELGLHTKDMSSFGSDGAAVFTGKRNGVGAKLKEVNSLMITYHCRDHRLALACRDTYAKIPAMKKTGNLLENIYKYYKYSCPNTASLKEVQTEAPLAIKQAKHHRWLSHEAAVTSIVKSYQSIVVDLEKKTIKDDPVGNGILKELKKTQTLRCLLFLADTLPIVSTLSKFFQGEKVNLGQVKMQMEKSLCLLQDSKEKMGPWQNKEKTITEKIGLHITSDDDNDFKTTIKTPFLDMLTENIKNRFEDSDIIENLAILDLSLEENIRAMYGLNEMEDIASHFNIEPKDLQLQWEDFCQLMNLKTKDHRTMDNIIKDFKREDTGLITQYPFIYKILSTALVLPLITGINPLRKKPPSLKKVPAGDSQTVLDSVKTALTPAGDFQTVCDGAKTVSQTGKAPAKDS
ncbi:zinc finger protein 862-like [Dreissena polymorpha]|uniref:zinc finger protein 862-like n=1 Tax=Dreissena polymorpha TaxID=45954 RepID=UPI002264668B|nr:zinc finger protein 862-like [Dreissena polymorpha]